MPWICDSCGNEVWSDENMVVLKNSLWLSIADKEDVLCDKCISKRLGRELRKSDLQPEPFCNYWYLRKHDLKEVKMNFIDKILKESLLKEDGILDQHIKNSETGRMIKVSSALAYDDSHPVKKAALRLIKKNKGAEPVKPSEPTVTKSEPVKNPKSHKPKSKSYGISKECVEYLKSKGFKDLNVLPQSFVKIEQIQFNPETETKGKDNVWAAKFPVILPNGTETYKTAYTKNFMRKSQVKKYKKISKIKEADIASLEEKTGKLLSNKDSVISDSAAVIGIILKTGLRIGSVDEENSTTGNLGVRTLKKENISVKGNNIKLSFIGKSYQENTAEFEDIKLAKYLSDKMKVLKPKDLVFNCSYSTVGKVMEKINPKGINPKDLRTYKATQFAKNLLEDKSTGAPPPLPSDMKEAKKLVQDKLNTVFTKVAELLNNTPAMAKNSYVHPVVIKDFLDNLGITPQLVGYKHITMEGMEQKTPLSATSLDSMFDKYANYGSKVDIEGLDEEDSDDCEEYPLPIWFDNDDYIFVKNK